MSQSTPDPSLLDEHDGWVAPQPAHHRFPRWLLIVIGVLVGLAALTLIGVLSTRNTKAATADVPDLAAAATACDPGAFGTTVSDGSKTLIINGQGAEDTAGITVKAEACILERLAVTSAVTAHMDSTRALDGRQTDSWGDYRAAWTYHPDSGLDLVIQQS